MSIELSKEQSPKWWIQETVARLQLCYPWMRGFAKMGRYFDPTYDFSISIFKDDYIWSVMEEVNDLKIAAAIHERFHADPGSLESILAIWRNLRVTFESDFELIRNSDMKTLGRQELSDLYRKFYQDYEDVFTPALLCEAFVPYAEQYVIPEISKLTQKLGIGKGEKLAGVLTVPLKTSSLTQERIDLLKITIKSLEGQDIQEDIVRHQQEYYWIKNNYKDNEPMTTEEFLGYVREDAGKGISVVKDELVRLESNPASLAKEKGDLMSRLQPDAKLVSGIKLFEILGEWQDDRKVIMQKASYYMTLLLRAIGQQVGLTFEQVAYATPEEVDGLLAGENTVTEAVLEQRRKFCAVIITKNEETVLIGDQAQEVWDKVFTKGQAREKAVYGVVACTGRVRGKVRIVKDPAKDAFEEGEILVTSMTRPEFVPYMKKALAIVTDEGGLTCHAAIVSRELNVPCIVGTKVATKVLKDGDLVEVNASHGSVTKLS